MKSRRLVRLSPLRASALLPPRDVAALQPRSARFGAGLDLARAALATWRRDGSMRPVERGWWAQRITGPGTDVVGLLATIDTTASPGDGLLPHENVFPEPVRRRVRLRHELGIEPRPSLVLLPDPPNGARHSPDAAAVLQAAFDGTEPALRDTQGRTHRVARLPDDVGRELAVAWRSLPALLADGHHRVGAAESPTAPEQGRAFAFVVPPAQQRMLWPVHRILRRLAADVEDAARSARQAGFGLREASGAFSGDAASPRLLTPTGDWDVIAGPPGWNTGLSSLSRDLPVSLAHAVATALGAGDRRDALGTAHDEDDVRRSLAAGAPAAVLVPGPTLDEVWRAATAGVRLPPKATSFNPKPIGGLLVRVLDRAGDRAEQT